MNQYPSLSDGLLQYGNNKVVFDYYHKNKFWFKGGGGGSIEIECWAGGSDENIHDLYVSCKEIEIKNIEKLKEIIVKSSIFGTTFYYDPELSEE